MTPLWMASMLVVIDSVLFELHKRVQVVHSTSMAAGEWAIPTMEKIGAVVVVRTDGDGDKKLQTNQIEKDLTVVVVVDVVRVGNTELDASGEGTTMDSLGELMILSRSQEPSEGVEMVPEGSNSLKG